MAMKSFKRFLEEYSDLMDGTILSEKAKDDASKPGGVSNNTKGVLHELLVGRHLNGGKHMEAHHSYSGESPEQVHDKLRSQIHPADYDKINKNAQSAAEDIRKQVERNGHKVAHVKWTSKPGDTEKVTGHKASQKEDASDIYVSTRNHPGAPLHHHGVSLKVSDNSSKNVPSSNLGSKFTGSKSKELIDSHRKALIAAHPAIGKIRNPKERKQYLKDNDSVREDVKRRNKELLKKTSESHADELQHHLDTGNHAHVMNHLRTVLAANSSPAQRDGGHGYIKHTTYQTKAGTQHHTIDPGSHYENYLNDHRKISVKASGGSVHFYHDGKKIASQSHKLSSQSDPLSSLASSGKATV
jgi:hypothetical protein